MYNVSSAYLNAIEQPTAKYKLRLTINGTRYTGEDVVGGSFSITNQCSETGLVQIGSVYTAQLKMTMSAGVIQRNTWEGAIIQAEEGLEIGENEYEYVPLGVFKVAEANHTEDGVDITAYDYMLNFDKSFNLSTTIGSPYSILKMICDDCRVQMGMTRAQIEAMPNGTQAISLYAENDCETYRDVLFWLAQLLASYATIGRDGKLYLRTYRDGHGTATADIDEYHRFEGGNFSDFVTEYTGVGYTDTSTQEYKYVSEGQDDKLTYNLGANPFLQYGTEATKKQMALNILRALKLIHYTPFRTEYLNTPAYDLGDIIVNEGGIGDGAVGCIMYYEYKFDQGYLVEGFGENPLLATARNKVDKDIAGLLSKTDSNSIQFYTFKSSEEAVIQDDETKELIYIRFATAEAKQVTFQAEILCDADVTAEDLKAQIEYYLDGALIEDYIPVETWSEDGKHIISLYYVIDVEPQTQYRWQVLLNSDGGTITVPEEHARGTIWGQGLVATNKWDGYIDVEDTILGIQLDSIGISTFDEDEEVLLITPIEIGVEDDVSEISLDSIAVQPIDDIVIMNKTSIYYDGMKWQDVYLHTWGAIFDEHTW